MNPAQSRSRRIYPKGARGVCPLCYQLLVDCVKCRECGSHYRDIRMPIRVGLGSHLCRASWHWYAPKPPRSLAEDPARPPQWVTEDAANVAGLGASDVRVGNIARAIAAAYARGRSDALGCFTCRGSGRVTILHRDGPGFHDEPCPECAAALRNASPRS